MRVRISNALGIETYEQAKYAQLASLVKKQWEKFPSSKMKEQAEKTADDILNGGRVTVRHMAKQRKDYWD